MFRRALALAACIWALGASAQRVHGHLPLESFSAAQGLANDSITTITTDSRGYLWFGTLDGMSRFDGDRFVNYTTDDGIPHRMVWSVAEDRNGSLWVGTELGAAKLTPTATRGRALFSTYTVDKNKPVQASLVFVDHTGTIWTSCDADLCFVRGGKLVVDPVFRRAGGWAPRAMVESPAGDLWIGSDQGLSHRRTDGSWRHYKVQPHRGGDFIHGLFLDPDGRLWIGNGWGLIIFAPDDADEDERTLAERAGPPSFPGMPLRLPKRGEAVAITVPSTSLVVRCQTPIRARDGSVWQPCVDGVLRLGDGRIDYYTAEDGLPPLQITTVGEDPAGDLWIGTRGAGAFRVARLGATSYTRAHGLAHQRILSIISLDGGTVCVTNPQGLSCFRGDEIHHGSPWPPNTKFRGWGWNQIVIHDLDGTWWFPTGEGLVHWPNVARMEDLGRVKPLQIYTARDGLGADEVFRIWKDSRGTIWASAFGDKPLAKFDRRTNRFRSFGVESGLPLAAPTAFAEDRDGNVWIGFYEGGLVRATSDDRFERITNGLPPGFVRDLKTDSKGRIWMGAMGGVARIDNPTAPASQLSIKPYSRKDGLASDSGYCIVEMRDGRMAIGSQRGLDILDADTGKVLHMTTREGLASNEISVASLDRNGALWLGTVNGLSRLSAIPTPQPKIPPQPRIHTITIDGMPTAVPELGVTEVGGVRIAYPRHSMVIGFSAPDLDAANPARFEYRLAGNRDWTDLGQQRAIAFDHLRAGSGTLEIRAVAGDRTSTPARVSFDVIPAVWKRTWFLALAAAVVLALAFALHRYRVAHLIAMERVRTRVATDLHDDLGSSLSRISILSEAAKRRSHNEEPILDEIADSARGLVDALGDSIWSIDPTRDDVRNLLLRVRNFADAIFEANAIAVDVRMPADAATIHLGPEERREVYLILKEALNNAAKHSGAQHVAIDVTRENGSLRIVVRDDGKGFARANGGRGVPSMRDRARRVGGALEISSEPGGGTSIEVRVPA